MPIQLQPRDLSAMSELGDVGLMSSNQLFERHYRPEDRDVTRVTFNRRMRDLTKAGYLDRTDITLSANRGIQKQPSVFRLTQEGADEVFRHFGYEPQRIARSEAPSAQTMMHRVGVTEVLLAFKDSANAVGLDSLKWLIESDREPGSSNSQPRDRQFVLYESFVVGREKFTCRPDACVLLQLPTGHQLAGYIEYDRSTEGKDQIQRTKLNGYRLMFGSQTYQNHWPNADKIVPRILFACKSKERIRNLQEWLGVGSLRKEFSFTLHEFLDSQILTDPVWWKLDDDVDSPGRPILGSQKSS